MHLIETSYKKIGFFFFYKSIVSVKMLKRKKRK